MPFALMEAGDSNIIRTLITSLLIAVCAVINNALKTGANQWNESNRIDNKQN